MILTRRAGKGNTKEMTFGGGRKRRTRKGGSDGSWERRFRAMAALGRQVFDWHRLINLKKKKKR